MALHTTTEHGVSWTELTHIHWRAVAQSGPIAILMPICGVFHIWQCRAATYAGGDGFEGGVEMGGAGAVAVR